VNLDAALRLSDALEDDATARELELLKHANPPTREVNAPPA
jgi:hypothetical protein